MTTIGKTEIKRRRGRPATGRDPTITIRIPTELLARLHKMHKSLSRENDRITTSDVAREAISLGLDHISGEKPARGEYLPSGLRPEHRAEIHEAGHAVMMFILGGVEDGDNPDHWVKKVVLKGRGGGAAHYGPILREFSKKEHRLWVGVAGAVADSMDQNLPFWDVWMSQPCSGDRRNAARNGFKDRTAIEAAADTVKEEFKKPDVWSGLVCLARGLTHGSRTGSHCWRDFTYGRDNWEDFVDQPRFRVVTPPVTPV